MAQSKRDGNDLGYTESIVDSLAKNFLFPNLKVIDFMSNNTENVQVYTSISDYTQKTGKRFRMTKDQKDRGLSRQQAFEEFNSRSLVVDPNTNNSNPQ